MVGAHKNRAPPLFEPQEKKVRTKKRNYITRLRVREESIIAHEHEKATSCVPTREIQFRAIACYDPRSNKRRQNPPL